MLLVQHTIYDPGMQAKLHSLRGGNAIRPLMPRSTSVVLPPKGMQAELLTTRGESPRLIASSTSDNRQAHAHWQIATMVHFERS
jgi:hypothetical protein